MTSSNIKNQQERSRHRVYMAALCKEQKLTEIQTKRDIRKTRMELVSMIAYKKAYREYSFHNIDESQPIYGNYERLNSKKYKDKRLHLNHDRVQTSKVVSFGESLSHNPQFDLLVIDSQSDFSEERFPFKVLEAKNFQRPKIRALTSKSQGRFDGSSEVPFRVRKKVFPDACRNTFTLRKLVDEKARVIIRDMSPETRRKREVQRILSKVSFPQLVNRDQTTSAIFRDYHQLQEKRQRVFLQLKSKKGSREENVTVKFPNMTHEEKISKFIQPDICQRALTTI